MMALLILGGVTSCKSHKKLNKNDEIGIEATIPSGNPHTHNTSAIRKKIAEESITWLGTPYGYGHCEKGVSTDCSGLVIAVYESIADIKLPRNSAEQADYCENLREKDVDMGDLVFFATGNDKKKVSHVGIMLDGEKFIHASGSKGVIISEMTTPYYRRTFIKYGKVPEL